MRYLLELVILAAISTCSICAVGIVTQADRNAFASFKQKHNKTYKNPAEETARLKNIHKFRII